MSKVVDITDKLELANPVLKIRNKEFEIRSDAKTVLKLAALDEIPDNQEKIAQSMNLLFGEEKAEELLSLPLSFKDLRMVIKTSMRLATGNDIDADEDGSKI
ncbi:MAG: hypothetical protein ACI4C1_08650 [Lachnospiraceae bacterium]